MWVGTVVSLDDRLVQGHVLLVETSNIGGPQAETIFDVSLLVNFDSTGEAVLEFRVEHHGCEWLHLAILLVAVGDLKVYE